MSISVFDFRLGLFFGLGWFQFFIADLFLVHFGLQSHLFSLSLSSLKKVESEDGANSSDYSQCTGKLINVHPVANKLSDWWFNE